MKKILRKIRSIKKDELLNHIRKKLWLKVARCRSANSEWITDFKLGPYIRKKEAIVSIADYFRRADKQFYFDDQDREFFADQSPRLDNSLAERAEKLYTRNYRFLNADFNFTESINWFLDPRSGNSWPKKFFKDIVYTGEDRLGDIKLPWEVSRHQFLITLGQAYVVTQNEKYAKEIIDIIDSWMEENRPYIGIHWTSALEVGIRLISWIWAFHFIKKSNKLSDEFIKKFISFIWLHADYLENNLNIGRYSNNHLVGEASALAMAGLYFNEFKKADKWRRKGLSILGKEALIQILPDGGGVEQAASYLRFILEFFLLAFILASKNGVKVSDPAMSRLESAFDFIAYSRMPDGNTPNFGDSDDARAIFLGDNNYWDFRGILALGAAIFMRGDFKWLAGQPSQELLWLGGRKCFNNFIKLKEKRPETTSVSYKESGYTILRDGWNKNANYLLFDSGSLGYKSGAHGHADVLSVQVSCFGENIFADPGTYAYNLDQEFRNYFRSTKAHNTVTVDGNDQAKMNGRMSWASIPEGKILNEYTSPEVDVVVAEHDGYMENSNPVSHQRCIIFPKTNPYFLIIDKLSSTGPHSYGLHYNLHPDMELYMDDGIKVVTPNNLHVHMDIKSSKKMDIEVIKGNKDPIGGWYSHSYGHREISHNVSLYSKGDSTHFVYSLITPQTSNQSGHPELKAIEIDEGLIISVSGNEAEDIWIINNRIDLGYKYQDIYFKGEMIWLQRNLKETMFSIYGVRLKELEINNRLIHSSEEVISGPVAGHCESKEINT